VLGLDLLLTIIVFLQMSGDAFSDSFRWTRAHSSHVDTRVNTP
jgi:hypothetical protein